MYRTWNRSIQGEKYTTHIILFKFLALVNRIPLCISRKAANLRLVLIRALNVFESWKPQQPMAKSTERKNAAIIIIKEYLLARYTIFSFSLSLSLSLCVHFHISLSLSLSPLLNSENSMSIQWHRMHVDSNWNDKLLRATSIENCRHFFFSLLATNRKEKW